MIALTNSVSDRNESLKAHLATKVAGNFSLASTIIRGNVDRILSHRWSIRIRHVIQSARADMKRESGIRWYGRGSREKDLQNSQFKSFKAYET